MQQYRNEKLNHETINCNAIDIYHVSLAVCILITWSNKTVSFVNLCCVKPGAALADNTDLSQSKKEKFVCIKCDS